MDYKYRVIECPCNEPKIIHLEVDDEDDAKTEAKRIVFEKHNACFIERFDGDQWEMGSIRYFWYFGQVCFWNHR